MKLLAKDSNWTETYFEKLCDLENGVSLILPKDRNEVIQYLKYWNRTPLDNSNTVDIINYEQLIFYEIEYKDDKDIQLLIEILKEKIANNYKIKALMIDNFVDKDLYEDHGAYCSQWGKKVGIWG